MIRLALLITGAILLTACASTQAPVVAEKPQYCNTSETVVVRNGETVDSATVVECTDDRIKKLFQVKSGMAPNCGEFVYWTKRGGHDVQRRGVSCQKPDGTWEIVNTGIMH
jgi:hypothetical protein